jgi:hypothetical protein
MIIAHLPLVLKMLNKLLFFVLIACSGNLLAQSVQPENELLWEISGNG